MMIKLIFNSYFDIIFVQFLIFKHALEQALKIIHTIRTPHKLLRTVDLLNTELKKELKQLNRSETNGGLVSGRSPVWEEY